MSQPHEWDKLIEGAECNGTEMEEFGYIAELPTTVLDPKYDCAMRIGIDLIQRYSLPCNLSIRDIPKPNLAIHARAKNADWCEIVLSKRLVEHGDERGRGAGHGPAFKQVATRLYEAEGFSRSSPGTDWGNL